MTAAGSELGQEFRDVRCSHSESLPALVTQLRLSLLVSTYQTGHLVVVAARQGRLVLTFHEFERAMGIAVEPGTIAICTRKEVWFLRDAQDIAAKLQRAVKHHGGCLIEVPSGRLLARGLALPHSPRIEGNQIFFLHSGQGTLDVIDSRTGQVTPIASVPGVARGLALHGGYAFVGLSRARPTLESVPVVARRDDLRCGLWVVDLRTGTITAHLEFCTGVEEVFDVQALPGIVFPYVSGPSAAKDSGQPLWTVPP